MKNTTCTCGSDKIESINKSIRTTGPKVKPAIDRFRKVSYGYFYTENTCMGCGKKWEIKK